MKKRSFIRNLSIMLFMQFVLLTVLFVALIVHMRNSAVTEMETAADNVLAIYRVNLENRIERANNILKNLTLSEETALEMIRSDKESDRYYAKKSIYTAMHAALLQDNAVDLLIVAENSYGGYMESTNGDSSKWALPYETRKAVETFTWELLGSGTRKNSWTIQEIAGEPFLYRAYMRNGHIVAAYISVQNFFSSNTDPAISNLCLALTDSNGYVWKTIGSELKNIPLGQTMQALGSNWKVNQLEIGDSSLYVTSYLNEYGITYTTQTSVLAVILIAIVALGCSAAIIFYTRRQIIKPMKDMTEKLHDMNGVTEGFQIQTSYGSQEFLVLRDTFNRMMRENVDLRLSAYKHHMEMQDSELRCIRLQLRPHFFLNAMTTISSLSMQGQNDSIKRYVEVLSKNIRYMFKSGMHTVPLSEDHLEEGMKTKQLSIEALQSARQTLLQIVYVELAKADCKAPDLFNNAVAQELSEKSVQSMMDFIRWANYLLSTAFSKLELTARQETISQKVHRYIKEHYAENIDRNSIAEEFYVNPEYLGKIYKRETGKNLKDAVSEYRIQKARELLSHPNIRIGEIAMEVGFDSFAYFSTLFKKYTGTTPNEYRKNLNVETKED